MILRNITKHLQDQNWFAVALDFVIVALGVGMALAAGDWINERAQKADLEVARLTIDKDVTTLYFNALERLAVKECRIAQIQNIAKKLQETNQTWVGLRNSVKQSAISGTIDGVLRSPFRDYPSRSWEAAKLRGLLKHIEPEQRQALEDAFMIAPIATELQYAIFVKQSQIKALLLDLELTTSDRLRYFDILAEIDSASSLLDGGLQATMGNLKMTLVQLAPNTLSEFYDSLRDANANGLEAYGDCFVPITLPNVDLTPLPAQLSKQLYSKVQKPAQTSTYPVPVE